MSDNNSCHIIADSLKKVIGRCCIIDAPDLSNDSLTDLEQTQSVASPVLEELLTPPIKPITVTPYSTTQWSLNLQLQEEVNNDNEKISTILCT